MTAITSQMVKQLRDMTGAGMMDCKKALENSSGSLDAAVDFLRKSGLKKVEKRAGKIASEGVVFSYIHPGSRVGVMLELNCETDFVARGSDFLALAKEIAMHIAWSKPTYVSREEVPQDVLEREKEIFRSQLKPGQEKVADRIITGKLEKFYEDTCLLEQYDARDTTGKRKIGDLPTELSAKVGEKIIVRRFLRYELGEGIEKPEADFGAEVAAAACGA
jgi:elongation factor Ts